MLAHFIEASVNFQNDTVFLMYGVITLALGVIATIMYVSGSRKHGK